MEKYTKKQFMDMVGVKFSTLRFYERIGLLSPEQDADNDYRLYSTYDAFLLNRFRKLRALGFSTNEAMDLKFTEDKNALLQQIEKQKNIARHELLMVQSRMEALQDFEENIQNSDQEEVFSFSTLPDKCFLPASTGNNFNKATYDVFSNWVDLLPVTTYCKQINLKNIDYEQKIEPDYGISINQDRAFLLKKKSLKNTITIKGGDCLRFYSKNFSFPGISPVILKKALKYIEDCGYTPKGTVYFEGITLHPTFQKNTDLIFIPFSKNC